MKPGSYDRGHQEHPDQPYDSSSRMATRHKGARVQDYAAMLKNTSVSPGQKRMKMSDGQYKVMNRSSKSKPSGLGWAEDSDGSENKHARDLNNQESDVENEEEGEFEQESG